METSRQSVNYSIFISIKDHFRAENVSYAANNLHIFMNQTKYTQT